MCKNSSTFDLLLKGDFRAKANVHLNRPFAEEKALPVAFKIQASASCSVLPSSSFRPSAASTRPSLGLSVTSRGSSAVSLCIARGGGGARGVGADVLCVVICAVCLRCCLSCCLRPGAETLARRLRRGSPLLEQRAA